MSYAQFPIDWLGGAEVPADEEKHFTLVGLTWRDHRAAGISALLILIILATRLNDIVRKARKAQQPVPDSVAVTWTELQNLTGHARATVGKGIMLLEGWGAIKMTRMGRSNVYQLLGVHRPGHYAALPINFLETNGDPVARFHNLPATPVGLNALKLYFVLLRHRSTSYGTTAISFNGITRWTGIRREDIRKAWGYLHLQQLAAVSTQRDPRHNKLSDNDQSQRYAIYGLTKGYTRQSLQDEIDANAVAEEYYRPGLPELDTSSEDETSRMSGTSIRSAAEEHEQRQAAMTRLEGDDFSSYL
jgi:hypothetical protein